VVQVTFRVSGVDTKLLLFADLAHDVIADIVKVTRYHERDEKLEWDVCKTAHHCSYTALSEDKGDEETIPDDEIDWLFRDQRRHRGIIISTSKPIPDDDEDKQPPHREAAKYYRRMARVNGREGKLLVTMEHPSKSAPEPIVIDIDSSKATVRLRESVGAVAAYHAVAPRAG
jgi:hypothetical protein